MVLYSGIVNIITILIVLACIDSYKSIISPLFNKCSVLSTHELYAMSKPPVRSSSPSSSFSSSSGKSNDRSSNNRRKFIKPQYKPNQRKSDDKNSASSYDIDDIHTSIKPDGKERLQKVISNAGITSRRNAEKYILDGRVTVNGKMMNEVGIKVDPIKDVINVDGKRLMNTSPEERKIFWIAINKPRNTLTTTIDDKERDTVIDLIPQAKDLRLLPIGRLERDTTGVLILTNENSWIHPLTHPSFTVPKTYEVVVEGIPTEAMLDAVRQDFVFKDVDGIESPIKGSEITIIDSDKRQGLSLLEIKFEDSNTAKIQKMMEFIKCPIQNIKRTFFGPIGLKGLKKGLWKELNTQEIDRLKQASKPADKDEINKMKSMLQRSSRGGGLGRNTRQSYYERMIAGKKSFRPKRNSPDSGITTSPSSSTSSPTLSNGDRPSIRNFRPRALDGSKVRKPGAGYYSRTIGRGFAGYTAPPNSNAKRQDVPSSEPSFKRNANNGRSNFNPITTTKSDTSGTIKRTYQRSSTPRPPAAR